MASKKYEVQAAHGRSMFAMVVAGVTLLGTAGIIAWFYSPDAWFFGDNTLQVHNVATELRKTLEALEAELARVRSESCGRKMAGPPGSVKSSTQLSPLILPDESSNPSLARQLKKLAVNKEIMVVLANENVLGMLRLLVASVQRVGIRNYIVVALDKGTASACEEMKAPVLKRFDMYHRPSAAGSNSLSLGSIISNLKFVVLRDFLVLGYSVLLSDVDIIYLQNPFHHLYRDADVEGMTDGHDNRTSYGYIDEWDDPPMGRCRLVHSTRMWVFNSGLFLLRPTAAAIELVDRVYARVSSDPKLWDQDVYNEELLYPSRPGYSGLVASKRVMDYLLFMNSKTLFSIVRNDEKRFGGLKPVTVHINYHSTKRERMQAVVDYYVHGDTSALSTFPEGDP